MRHHSTTIWTSVTLEKIAWMRCTSWSFSLKNSPRPVFHALPCSVDKLLAPKSSQPVAHHVRSHLRVVVGKMCAGTPLISMAPTSVSKTPKPSIRCALRMGAAGDHTSAAARVVSWSADQRIASLRSPSSRSDPSAARPERAHTTASLSRRRGQPRADVAAMRRCSTSMRVAPADFADRPEEHRKSCRPQHQCTAYVPG